MGLLVAAPAAAQSTAPGHAEQVVVTGTAAPATAGAVGRTLAVITADDLRGRPVTSVADALRLLPGVWVRARGPFGSQTDLSVRGAGFGQTLVLVDGVRLNDPQTGHHTGDVPLALEDVARIELLAGAGSSLHGADAVGGVINIITRRDSVGPSARVAAGQHGLVQAGLGWRPAHLPMLTALSASVDRSAGFAPTRDFLHQQARAEMQLGGIAVALAHLDKDFGAAGYYGPAPSREWTSQTLLTARRGTRIGRRDLALQSDAWYRTHGDEFLYDSRQAAAQPSRHRTHAIGGGARLAGRPHERVRVTGGGEVAADWLRSSVLGDRHESRLSGFGEIELQAGRLVLYPSLRVDGYSTYGTAWSPSVAAAVPVQPRLKWRASLGRAFRVPTFTERFYQDPNHRARADLEPERGWTADSGVDAYLSGSWMASATAFVRRERNVIDWIRPTAADRWQTANIRQVRSHGLETTLRGRQGPVAIGLHYAWTRVETDRLDGLSKYVDDYAPHGLGTDLTLEWPGVLQSGLRVEHRRPLARPAYTTLDVRLARPVRRVVAFVEVSNLGAVPYEEIRGVAMPGRWVRAGVIVR